MRAQRAPGAPGDESESSAYSMSTQQHFEPRFALRFEGWPQSEVQSDFEVQSEMQFFYELCPDVMYEIEKEITEEHENL